MEIPDYSGIFIPFFWIFSFWLWRVFEWLCRPIQSTRLTNFHCGDYACTKSVCSLWLHISFGTKAKNPRLWRSFKFLASCDHSLSFLCARCHRKALRLGGMKYSNLGALKSPYLESQLLFFCFGRQHQILNKKKFQL